MSALTKWRNQNRPARREERRDPFSALQNEINQLFDRDLWNWGDMPGLFDGDMYPALDIKDKEDSVEVRCDLPGVDKKDIDISVSGNTLTIKGEKNEEKEEKESNYYRKESWSGSFQRSVALPDSVDPDKADASMKNGILTLTLPKKEDERRKKISVKGE
ncbi:MAG: Hsp20/alpha crystallin family protein [Spirochaetaceae bacterium]